MQTKKPPKKATAPKAPPWQMILEEIRSQHRVTIEAIEASRDALTERIDRLGRETRDRGTVLELAIRELRLAVQQNSANIKLQGDVWQNSADIQQLQGDVRQNSAETQQLQGDVRDLIAKVEALARIEERVAAIEKRIA